MFRWPHHCKRFAQCLGCSLLTRGRTISAVCRASKKHWKANPHLFSKVRTGNESWFCGYHRGTEEQLSQWNASSSPGRDKARHVRWNVKTILTLLSNPSGIAHSEVESECETVSDSYCFKSFEKIESGFQGGKKNVPICGRQLEGDIMAKHHDSTAADVLPSVAPLFNESQEDAIA